MPDEDTGELVAADVATFTGGRIPADSARLGLLLPSALTEARRYCGWHVTPPRSDTLILDGPGSPLLALPTLSLGEVTALSENGVELDVDTDITWSHWGMVRKTNGGYWTAALGGIEVTITHGFANAQDFQAAVLAAVDAAVPATVRDDPNLLRKKVDDVEYQWAEGLSSASRRVLDQYRLEPAP